MTIKKLTQAALQFRDERDWKQFHNAKDLAIALQLEAAEVLELMQWKSGKELESHLMKNHEALADELSDVLHAIVLLAHDHDIDLAKSFLKKLDKNRQKYPIHKARGQAKKYTEL